MRQSNCKFKVTKNRIVKLALKETNYEHLEELFKDEKEYRWPAPDVGNVPTLKCKPGFDLWERYRLEMGQLYE